jgi:hypothetical protein
MKETECELGPHWILISQLFKVIEVFSGQDGWSLSFLRA